MSQLDNMTKIFNFPIKEITLVNIQCNSGISKSEQNFFNMTFMILDRFRVNYDIFDVDETRTPLKSREDQIQ